MAMRDVVRRSAVVCLMLLAPPASGRAQEVATTFDQLRVLVGPGDELRITGLDGREVKGKVDALTDSSLDLLVHGSSGSIRTFRESDVVRIRQRKDDSLVNGTRNGFLAGAGLGLLAGLVLQNETRSPAIIPYAIAIYGGLGAGIGAGIDAMIVSQRTIYSSRIVDNSGRPARSIAVMPTLSSNRKAVRLTLGF